MNWKKKFMNPKEGDRVRIIKTRPDIRDYKVGDTFILGKRYIIDGIWVFNGESINDGTKDTYWDNGNHGLNQNDFEVIE